MILLKRLFLISILLATTSLLAVDPDPPMIRSIAPATGPASGGTLVAITGERLTLPAGYACILPCPAEIHFGGVKADLLHEEDTMLLVRTPPHGAGSADVEVTTGDGRKTAVPSAFTFTSSSQSEYEPVLIPIHLPEPVPGAAGSVWETRFRIRNNGTSPVALAPWVCETAACPAVFPLTRTLLPSETLDSLPKLPGPATANRSRLLWMNRARADEVSLQVRLLERSRGDEDAGTELPVIREPELHTSALTLHAVPLDAQFRLTLRIYDLANEGSKFRVKLYADTAGTGPEQPIAETVLIASSDERGEFRARAAYAETAALRDLLNVPTILPESLRVVVEPLTPGSRFWSFISLTNEVTQRVTLVTPQ